jgi:1,3,6,8-tetrahydroxynaphthalene synthase
MEASDPMPVLTRPAVAVPEHRVTLEETLEFARMLYADHEQLPLVLRLIANTGVRTRHIVQPLAETLRHPGFEERNRRYEHEAKMAAAGLEVEEIDAIVYASCTGFMMPSLTAWMINKLGFRNDTRQMPIAQLGCAAGGAAINRAHDFALAHPGSNVLIVACEFCSLCYQPTDLSVGNLLSNGLFGDAVAAAVVRGDDGACGVRLERNGSWLVPDTEDWIAYAVKSTGFHFLLDKRVPATMRQFAPVLETVAGLHGWQASALDFYVIHAGGPRILDDLSHFLGVQSPAFAHSRATLREHGNIASAVVLDALRRAFDSGTIPAGARGIIAGFGPGITAEISLGSWHVPGAEAPAQRSAAIHEARA